VGKYFGMSANRFYFSMWKLSLFAHTHTHTHRDTRTRTRTHSHARAHTHTHKQLEVTTPVDAEGEVANEDGPFLASDSCRASVASVVRSGRVLKVVSKLTRTCARLLGAGLEQPDVVVLMAESEHVISRPRLKKRLTITRRRGL
jgi:hypothetical protein